MADLITSHPAHDATTPYMARRDQVAFAFFASWTVVGLFVDGWAHEHDKPETFFTPWHLLLYSGFVTGVLWGAWDGRRQRRGGGETRASTDRLTTAGLVMFIGGAVGDGVWHEVVGVEVDLEALLSPTHLLLMTGGILLITAPQRAMWAAVSEPGPRSLRQFAPALVSLTLATAVASFFSMYLSAFDNYSPGRGTRVRISPEMQDFAHAFVEMRQVEGVASIVVTNLVLMVPVFIALRRWRPPMGSFTILFTTVATGMVGMQGFERPQLIAVGAVGGLVADGVVWRWNPGVGREREVRVLAGVVPAAMWLTFFAVYHAVWGVGWSPDLWAGSVFLAVASSMVLSVLAFPARAPVTEGESTVPGGVAES